MREAAQASRAEEGDARVVEATIHGGVVEVSLREFLRGKHEVAVLRPLIEADVLVRIAEQARRCVGAPYDFGFTIDDNGRYYCSKLVVHCVQTGLGARPFRPRWHWGGRGLTADDLYGQTEVFEVVFESRSWRPSDPEARGAVAAFA